MNNSEHANESSLGLGLVMAVVLAGVAGTIANAIAAGIVIIPSAIRLALVPGRYAVAVAVAALLPFIFRLARPSTGTLLGLVALTALPSLLAKLVFNAHAPWPIVGLLNAVYALAALIVYRVVANQTRRSAAQRL
jgi:hypothetical protein